MDSEIRQLILEQRKQNGEMAGLLLELRDASRDATEALVGATTESRLLREQQARILDTLLLHQERIESNAKRIESNEKLITDIEKRQAEDAAVLGGLSEVQKRQSGAIGGLSDVQVRHAGMINGILQAQTKASSQIDTLARSVGSVRGWRLVALLALAGVLVLAGVIAGASWADGAKAQAKERPPITR